MLANTPWRPWSAVSTVKVSLPVSGPLLVTFSVPPRAAVPVTCTLGPAFGPTPTASVAPAPLLKLLLTLSPPPAPEPLTTVPALVRLAMVP
ncbi:Uncharacterised protein [Achromobacter sp. 2789STDY5608615]|nr:Uncharacterised protein [Achromobacter sp. 2789STDY5608621]CUK22865.1 Uncharacterised protein [Achromobacter sp. 2789STDY5608615]